MDLFNENYATITPACGRDYKSKKAFLADFRNNKDFLIITFNGRILINHEQIEPGTILQARYASNRKTSTFKV